jgi:hypothetical protein
MVLLQRLERVLKDRVFRHFFERLRELSQVHRALVPDARKVRGRVEVEG